MLSPIVSFGILAVDQVSPLLLTNTRSVSEPIITNLLFPYAPSSHELVNGRSTVVHIVPVKLDAILPSFFAIAKNLLLPVTIFL